MVLIALSSEQEDPKACLISKSNKSIPPKKKPLPRPDSWRGFHRAFLLQGEKISPGGAHEQVFQTPCSQYHTKICQVDYPVGYFITPRVRNLQEGSRSRRHSSADEVLILHDQTSSCV